MLALNANCFSLKLRSNIFCRLQLTSNFPSSIRRRALDLLYGMCDVSNAKDIVEELLQV